MDVPTMMMPKQKALEKLDAYRERLRKGADAEYEAAVKGYEALAQGKVLLDLVDVFADVPYDEKERPMLAIARADRKQVRFSWDRGVLVFDTRTNYYAPLKVGETLGVRVDAGRLPLITKTKEAYGEYGDAGTVQGHALVPMVPADVRPNVDPKKCHVLWEVPAWADNRITAAPADPYLVQHLAGTLWVVLAEWELTPLEMAITRGRQDR
ncbi:MAG: hypothetical protein ACRD6I_20225 [Candidatus Acidiferrales bacterium]